MSMNPIFPGLTTTTLLISCFVLPLFSFAVKKRRKFLDAYVLIFTFFAELLAIITFYNVFFVLSEPMVYKFGGWVPPIGIIYEVDKLNSLFGLMTATIVFLMVAYSTMYMKRDRIEWFYTLLLSLETGLLGMIYTGDAFNLFVMLEVTNISMYCLTAFYRARGEVVDSALKYAMLGAVTSSFYFVALIFFYASYGTLNMADLSSKASGLSFPFTGTPYGNIFVGTAIAVAFTLWTFTFKAGLFPNHFWVPDVNSAAPAPVAALSGLVVSNGAYVTIRFLYTIFGGTNLFPALFDSIKLILIIIGSFSAIFASLLMLLQKDVKRLVGCSTIFHMGLIFMGIGLGTDLALKAAIFHIINHAVGKALLFTSIGSLAAYAGSKRIDRLGSVGRYAPTTFTALMVGVLVIEGLPPFNGFMSKFMLYSAFLEVGLAPVAIIIIVSTAIALMAWMRVLFSAWFKKPDQKIEKVREFPTVIIPVILVVICIVLGLLTPTIDSAILTPTVSSLKNVDSYIQAALSSIGG
ncbi:MAG: multicomponent Na+:H+ antiporter subunit [Thermoproteota archaeon]|nr:multicomponent Na+:H+ antiporter subunit [Thermoproteota archaeon]